MNSIRIGVSEHDGVARSGQIVSAGVPLPRGFASPARTWSVRSPRGELLNCQTDSLALWFDGSVQWMTVTFPATVQAHQSADYLLTLDEGRGDPTAARMVVQECANSFEFQTGNFRFRVPRRGQTLLEASGPTGHALTGTPAVQAEFLDQRGVCRFVCIEATSSIASGPLVARISWTGHIPMTELLVQGEWTFRAGSPAAELSLTLHNPSRARHPHGCWDLGDPGSVLFQSFSLRLPAGNTSAPAIRWREQSAAEWHEQIGGRVVIQQHTSGGPNDRSRNHINRLGQLPASPSGYAVQAARATQTGLRATPLCSSEQNGEWIVAGIHEFWQQFPKSLEASASGLAIGLFPALASELHELQGGEQKTTRIALAFGAGHLPETEDMLAVLAPLTARCDRDWMASTGALWRLPRQPERLHPQWQIVAQHAVQGERGFFGKREAADEYGWRNFGDLWADHEQTYYDGQRPIVSHYNNQYDALEAFLLAYLVTGDRRFWELADPLARHVIDIDIYRTSRDKAAYNGGQFWHTNHYRDAATATHRAYSASNHPEGGGGPSNEQNYSSGLTLYHYLTGNRQARETVIGLAEWVLNMDEGAGHWLGLLDETPTGFASNTAETSYHSPGRGAANSINTLLDGWLLTQRPEFLHKLEELVRRAIHPCDDIAALNLPNAELRWSYAIFLQTLVRCLALAQQFPLTAELQSYMRASLLHYARWMARSESFYLDQPEQLEFPTETWAAHEIRKANVLTAAAHLADDQEAGHFRQRAAWFEDRAWTTLMQTSTWHYTRPMVLALQLGLYAAVVADEHCRAENQHPGVASFPQQGRAPFVPQRESIRRGLRSPVQVLAMAGRSARVWKWPRHWQATWTAQRLRRFWSGLGG